jgi:hypothetical protein
VKSPKRHFRDETFSILNKELRKRELKSERLLCEEILTALFSPRHQLHNVLLGLSHLSAADPIFSAGSAHFPVIRAIRKGIDELRYRYIYDAT